MTHEYTIANDDARSFLNDMENEPPALFDMACELLLGVTPDAYNEMQEYANRQD